MRIYNLNRTESTKTTNTYQLVEQLRGGGWRLAAGGRGEGGESRRRGGLMVMMDDHPRLLWPMGL